MNIKKISILIIGILISSAVLTSCGKITLNETSYAMDSLVTQTIYSIHSENCHAAAADAIAAIAKLEALISYRDEKSDIYKLNKSGEASVDKWVETLLYNSYLVSQQSGGAYDVTVLPAVLAWGFDGNSPGVPEKEVLGEAVKKIDYNNVYRRDNYITLENGAAVDLSASGKGGACDVAYGVYRNAGISGAIISVGGSVAVYGLKDGGDFKIGIKNPFDTSKIIGTLSLQNTFISTSGSYEKYFIFDEQKYHHILDPKTGYPSNSGLISVTVVCPDGGALSDMLSTACFVMGIEDSKALLKAFNAEAVFIQENGRITVTDGLKDKWELN